MGRTKSRRIILVGRSGNGKSSTGNSLLREDVFKSDDCFESVTQECQRFTKFLGDIEYTIEDTPGLCDTQIPFARRALQIQKALETCPNPHAFLIVLRPDQRFTEEDRLVIDMLRIIFGQGFLNHAVLVFTRGSKYKSDQQLNDVIARCDAIKNLKLSCGNRVVRVENDPDIRTVRNDLLNKVFDCVEQVSDGGKKMYVCESLDVHRTCLEQHLENRKPDATLREDIEHLLGEISHQFEEMKKAEKEAEEAKKREERVKKELEEEKKKRKKESDEMKKRMDKMTEDAENEKKMAEKEKNERKKESDEMKKRMEKMTENTEKANKMAETMTKMWEEEKKRQEKVDWWSISQTALGVASTIFNSRR